MDIIWICIYIIYIYTYYGYSWIIYTTIVDAYPHYEYIHISVYIYYTIVTHSYILHNIVTYIYTYIYTYTIVTHVN